MKKLLIILIILVLPITIFVSYKGYQQYDDYLNDKKMSRDNRVYNHILYKIRLDLHIKLYNSDDEIISMVKEYNEETKNIKIDCTKELNEWLLKHPEDKLCFEEFKIDK